MIGETPNLAARLQTLDEPNSVVISAATRAMLGNHFDLRGAAGYFQGDRILSGVFFETHLGLVFLIELFSDGRYLPPFEFGDLDRAPGL